MKANKPTFDITEIKAEIKGLSTIDEDIDIAKKEKANINKAKDQIDTIRKDIVKKYNEPLEKFVNTAKETVKILEEAYDYVGHQVYEFEENKKDEIRLHLQDIYNSYIENYNLETLNIPFEDACPKVNLSGSMKSKEDSIIAFVEKINNDIMAMGNDEYYEEILHEYLHNGYDYAKAKLTILNKHIELEEIKKREQKLKEIQEQEKQVVEKVDEIIAPMEIEEKQEIDPTYVLELQMTIWCTKEQAKELQEWLKEKNIRYE